MLYRSQARTEKPNLEGSRQSPLAHPQVSKVPSKLHTHQDRHNAIVLLGHASLDNQDLRQLRHRIHSYMTPHRWSTPSIHPRLLAAMRTQISRVRLHGHEPWTDRHLDIHGAQQMTKLLRATELLYRSAMCDSRAIVRRHSRAVCRNSLQQWTIGGGKALKAREADHESVLNEKEKACRQASHFVPRELRTHGHHAMGSITQHAAALLSNH